MGWGVYIEENGRFGERGWEQDKFENFWFFRRQNLPNVYAGFCITTMYIKIIGIYIFIIF